MDNQVETIYEETVGYGTANVTAERNWVCANPICRTDGRKAADACVSLKRISTMKLVKKIGKTTYKVRVHFSNTSTETMSDKIKRMLKNEIQQM